MPWLAAGGAAAGGTAAGAGAAGSAAAGAGAASAAGGAAAAGGAGMAAGAGGAAAAGGAGAGMGAGMAAGGAGLGAGMGAGAGAAAGGALPGLGASQAITGGAASAAPAMKGASLMTHAAPGVAPYQAPGFFTNLTNKLGEIGKGLQHPVDTLTDPKASKLSKQSAIAGGAVQMGQALGGGPKAEKAEANAGSGSAGTRDNDMQRRYGQRYRR